jgi:trehalose 6-phosphate synthase
MNGDSDGPAGLRDWLRFLLPLMVVLGGLCWAAWYFVDATSRGWFEKDVRMRSELVVNGVRDGMVASWRAGDADGIKRVLGAITRDERIMGAQACDLQRTTVAEAGETPADFSCASLRPDVGDRESWRNWHSVSTLRGLLYHVSAIPLIDGEQPLGYVVLVHDLGFVERRGSAAQLFTLLAFGVLVVTASLLMLVAARSSWKRWTLEVRRLLRSGIDKPEFRPLLADVRELVGRIAADTDGSTQAWTPSRLKLALKRYLHGEKVIMVANREPYIHERKSDGEIQVLHPASGLVSAVEPVMRACSGVWVAHGSGSADRETADRDGRVWVPPDERAYQIRRVWLSPDEEQGYYYGFSNEGLWPLCHIAHTRPMFRADDWAHYQRVNRRFAEIACSEAGGDDPIILVQDYHFALAPRMIRERLPRATILSFWHIPWPNAERFGICPWREEILRGMLGSSILGFHTQSHCNNFLDTVDRFLEARIDREQFGVVQDRRTTLVRPYPISIEWPNRWQSTAPPVADCKKSVFEELALPNDALLAVGVDRLDYTKGVEERFIAVERLLERFPQFRGRFCLAQLAAPSRTAIDRYRDLGTNIDRLVTRINERFGSVGYRPILYLRGHHEPPTVFRFYRAADVAYVSSLHDGMNLVAKEFVAARDDERGVLVLSSFTGASRELTEALIVNPYDTEAASEALAAALTMPAAEQAERMRAMRAVVAHFNVYRWAGRMLIDAAQLRQRDRLTGRLPQRLNLAADERG